MLKGLISSILAVGSMSAPIFKEAVSIDSSTNTIVVTSDELEDYSFLNYYNVYSNSANEVYPDGTTWSIGNTSESITELEGPNGEMAYGNSAILLASDGYFYSNGNRYSGDYSLTISSESDFTIISGAIEQDIQANQPSQNTMPSVSDLFGYITQGVTAFIGSIGEAFNSVVALFWTTGTNAGPTFLGLLMLVSIGAGLIFLAYNVIKKLIYRLRG